MGRLDRLFGNTKAIVEEAVLDEQRCIELFGKLLTEFKQKETLAKNFANPAKVQEALQNWDNTLNILGQIEDLIPQELVNIGEEEKLEDELLRDIESLKNVSEIRSLASIVAHEKKFKEALFALFAQIHRVLVIELHLIMHIRKKRTEHLLIKLFRVINFTEDALYEVFMEENHEEKALHQEVMGLAHAVLLEKEINDAKEVTDERFERLLVAAMGPVSDHKYRRLAEEIFRDIADRAGVQLPMESDFEAGLEAIENMIGDDDLMCRIISKFLPGSERKIWGIVCAFRKAFHMSHFIDLEQEFD
ncbi:MAG: hypothetical protein KKC75_08490 [Nanoarchaeota archaeon]|nr:hypothetical protein [Nanoarchaeota archaeon]MBU1005397.1 hypothetical protein [Nanoarchaeota archaeon]MBU1945679.1 hypothetical protein [Nanoarchaeota archaeon]